MKTAGIVLIIIGILMFIFTGFNVITKKKVVDIGSIEVKKEEATPISWSPILAACFVVVGVSVIVIDRRKAK